MFRSFIKSSPTEPIIDCPEKRLFVAVLSQAVHDAFSSHVPGLEKRSAQSFLTSNNEDFKMICELAGRDPAYVRRKVMNKILKEKGWNMEVTARIAAPVTRKRGKYKKKHLTGNAYYAAKRKEIYGNAISMD
jgi:hypothetical protein